HLLGVILADDIVVEDFANFLRRRNAVTRFDQRGFILLANDVHAKFDAFIADEHGRAGDELADFVLALSAERAVERVLGIAAADFAHSILRHTRSSCVVGEVSKLNCLDATQRTKQVSRRATGSADLRTERPLPFYSPTP